MSGFYVMQRGWMDHDMFLTNEPYTKREAWCWLIEHAAWEDHTVAWNGNKIEVKRGQVPASFRVMSKKMRWSTGRVARFLKELKTRTMVETQTDTGFCIITICNYNEYQFSPKQTKTVSATDTDTDADTPMETNNKNKNNIKKNTTPPTPRKTGGSEPALLENLPTQFKEPCRFESEFWPLYPKKKNKVKAKEAYDEARKKDTQSNIIAGVRAYRREWENDPRGDDEKNRFIKWPQGWLNEERWRDYTESTEPDEDKMPEGMSPAEHAAWNLRRIGHV